MSPRHGHHNRNGRTDSDTVSTDFSGSLNAPAGLQELFWQQIEDRIAEMVAEYTPTLGTVVGMDGGAVRVQLDEEDDPREVGFPRKKGTRYDTNERVLVGKTRGGRHVVLGPITDQQGQAERAVANEDLHDDAVQRRNIQVNSVGPDEIAGGSVGSGHITNNAIKNSHMDSNAVDRGNIRNNAIGNSQLDSNAVDTGNMKDNSVTRGKLDNNVSGDITDAKKAGTDAQKDVNDLKPKVTDAASDAKDAKSDAKKANDDIVILKSDIKKIKSRLDKLESHN